MKKADSTTLLSSIFRPDQNDARPTILLGAGASFSSGIPMAGECVRRIAKRVYADRIVKGGLPPERIKPSEWMTWLSEQEWFIPGDHRLAENFPLIIENLLTPQAYRRRVMMDLIHHDAETSTGYASLANLVLRGLAGTILTTNFDPCLPKALKEKHPHIRHVFEANRSPNDFNEFDLFARSQIVWLHGKAEQYTDCNLVDEVNNMDESVLSHLGPLLDSTPLVVAGYRGAELSIMDCLLGDDSGRLFRKGVFWCRMKGEDLHPNAKKLQARLGANFHDVEIAGFDQIFQSLDAELAGDRRFFESPSSSIPSGFDDEVKDSASWADIDSDLALSTLKEYAKKVGPSDLKAESLKPFMRDLGLLQTVDGQEKPSNGAVLLFGRNPQRFFPSAIVSATVDGKKRQIISGNLLKQRQELLEWFDSDDVNPVLKVKGRLSHEERKAYADRALVELLMNMLVHRNYDIDEPARIDVSPNFGIEFVNPGNPPELNGDLAIDETGTFEPVPQYSNLQNRSICDVFFGLSAIERAGTGLIDVQELATEYGGTSSFAYPPNSSEFIANLFRVEASAGSSDIAKNRVPIGSYTINMMPFNSVPDTLQEVPIEGGWNDLTRLPDIDEAGTFLFLARAGMLYSFAPAAVLSLIFGKLVCGPIIERPMTDADDDVVFQRHASWLIRKHFEAYLQDFESEGLILELTRKNRPAKRAYFTAEGGEPRTLTYDSAKRKGVQRGVAKLREVGAQTWFECEGFAYEIIKTSGSWGIRIKPYYMFTKPDGITPLPGFQRTKKATSRFKFDRNGSVDSDLNFWERLISRGSQVVNLGRPHADDLLLRGSFFKADVEEKGLVTDDSSAKDKRSA